MLGINGREQNKKEQDRASRKSSFRVRAEWPHQSFILLSGHLRSWVDWVQIYFSIICYLCNLRKCLVSLNCVFHVGNVGIITSLMGFFEELVYNIHLLSFWCSGLILSYIGLLYIKLSLKFLFQWVYLLFLQLHLFFKTAWSFLIVSYSPLVFSSFSLFRKAIKHTCFLFDTIIPTSEVFVCLFFSFNFFHGFSYMIVCFLWALWFFYSYKW